MSTIQIFIIFAGLVAVGVFLWRRRSKSNGSGTAPSGLQDVTEINTAQIKE